MPERLILEGFEPFVGKHCETTALKRVLGYHALHLSEEILFGLGGGIGFIYWYIKTMPAPLIGGRYGRLTDFSRNICRRIGAELTIVETSSSKKGYEELKAQLCSGEPAVVYVDMVYLPYLVIPEVAHFGGHAIVVFGLDEPSDEVCVYDRGKNPVTVSINDLTRARGSQFPPFPPKNRILKITYPAKIGNLEEGIKESIRECCQNMLEPPIRNIGLAGIEKFSKTVMRWPEQFQGISLLGALMNGFMYIEIGGTGGSAFRSMYARFLEEASHVINQPVLKEVAEMMWESAAAWSEVASGFLPDSWPNLKRMRELMFEKNHLFEEQAPGALEAMITISGQFDELMKEAVADLKRPPSFLTEVQQSILRCYQIESKAFEKLSAIVR